MFILRTLPLRTLILYLGAASIAIQLFLIGVSALFTPGIAPAGQLAARLDTTVERASSHHVFPAPHTEIDGSGLGAKERGEQALTTATSPSGSAKGTLTDPAVPSPIIPYKVVAGDSLSSIWKKHGAPYAGALRASSALKESGISGSSLRAGETIELQLSADGEIVLLKKRLQPGKTLELRGDSQRGYTTQVIEIPSIEVERSVSGSISSSFAAAALDVSIPYDVVDELVDIFGPRIEFSRSLQRGDRFTVIYPERRTEDGVLLDSGAIKAAAIEVGGKLLSAVRHVGSDEVARYYDERGEPLGNFFLRYPLKFSRISSVFSHARFHPVLGVKRPHNGVDFAAPTGTPVRAVADGVVELAAMRGGGGLTVFIKHSERYTTAYLHLSKINVRRGERVNRGELIGAVGQTGLATGPHLHFSLYDRGAYVDPLGAELPRVIKTNDKIPNEYLVATLNTLRRATDGVLLASTSTEKIGG